MDLSNCEPLGEGANGKVFRCRDALGRDLAVKFFTNSFDPVSRQVADHAAALKDLNHPNVVRVIAAERLVRPDRSSPGQPELALVMEYVAGVGFPDWLNAAHPDPKELKTFGDGLLDGLAAFHSHGLAHCDLHAGNVKVAAGIAKIIDPLAQDPELVLTTALNADRQRRDARDAHALLREAMISFDIPSAAMRRFGDPRSLPTSILALRLLFHECISITSTLADSDAGSQLSTYARCRQLQSTGDAVGWQELRKSVLKNLPTRMDSLRKDFEGSIDSQADADELIRNGLLAASDYVGMLLASAETPSPLCLRDVRDIDRLLRLDWPQSGVTVLVKAPSSFTFAIGYLVGATALLNESTSALAELSTCRIVDHESEEYRSFFEARRVLGWPETLSSRPTHYWNWLKNLYGSLPLLREVFPTERDYRLSLAAFNLYGSICGVRFSVESGKPIFVANTSRDYALPPLWIVSPAEDFVGIWKLLGVSAVRDVLASTVGGRHQAIRNHWRDFVEFSADYWRRTSDFEMFFVPKWIRQNPPI